MAARRATRKNLFGLGKKAPAKRRRAAPAKAPGPTKRAGSWLWGEVSGRHDREALQRRFAATQPKARTKAERAEEERWKRSAHAETMRELREQRAATALAIQAERLREAAYRARLAEDRAKSAEARRSAKGKAETAEKRAGEMEEMGRKAERGELSPDQLRYWISTYGRRGAKR